jgi:hypothetical protein
MRLLRLAIIVATVSGLALTGCGSDSTNANSTSSTGPSTTKPAGSTSSTRATVASIHCATNELSASLGNPNAGAGQVYTPLVLTNTGNRTCELRGFPGVSVLDASGNQIGQPASREGSEGATVSIAPGKTASATLHTTNQGVGGSSCSAQSSKMKVFPPDDTVALTFAAGYTVCGGFQVSTLVAGSAGR